MKKISFLFILFLSLTACQLVSCQPCFDGYLPEVIIHQFSLDRTLESTTQSGSRWIEYETALATTILPSPSDPGLCEWEVWGQKEQEVYVWAICQTSESATGAAASVPAVLSLAQNGDIEQVTLPRDGINYGPDIELLFPPDVQTRIFENQFDAVSAMEHIEKRRQDESIPPMIVDSGVTLP